MVKNSSVCPYIQAAGHIQKIFYVNILYFMYLYIIFYILYINFEAFVEYLRKLERAQIKHFSTSVGIC